MKTDAIDQSFKQLARQLSEAVVVTDAKGGIIWTNQAFRELCGYTLKEVTGQQPGHFLQGKHTNKKTVRALHNAVKNGTPIQVEIVNYHKNGTPYWASVSITPLKDKKDQLEGFVAIEKDTTAQHKQLTSLEEEVVQVYNALLLSEGLEEACVKGHG